MRHTSLVSLLGALALGPVSHGQIKVAVMDQASLGTVSPVQITGAVGVGNHVQVSTQQLRDALLNAGVPLFEPFILWVYDQASTTGGPTLDIGSITITWSTSAMPTARLCSPTVSL